MYTLADLDEMCNKYCPSTVEGGVNSGRTVQCNHEWCDDAFKRYKIDNGIEEDE